MLVRVFLVPGVSGHYLWLLMAPVIGDTYTGTLYTPHRLCHRVAKTKPPCG